MSQKSLPTGAMFELDVHLIDEGRLVRQINESLREAHRALLRRKDEGTTGGACKITVDISMGYDPDMRETVCITNSVTLKTPKNESVTLVKEKAGRLLCQPTGSSEDAPEQQRLFDAAGRAIGLFDPKTGEVLDQEESAVAGSIRG